MYKFKEIPARVSFFCALMKEFDNFILVATSPLYRRLSSVFTTKNTYLFVNFVIFSRKYELYIGFRFLFYIFAAEFYFKQRQL